MNLYTIVLEFKGGTYVSQFECKPHQLINKWCYKLLTFNILGRDTKRFVAAVNRDTEGSFELEGLQNVDQLAIRYGDQLYFPTIIQTERNANL